MGATRVPGRLHQFIFRTVGRAQQVFVMVLWLENGNTAARCVPSITTPNCAVSCRTPGGTCF